MGARRDLSPRGAAPRPDRVNRLGAPLPGLGPRPQTGPLLVGTAIDADEGRAVGRVAIEPGEAHLRQRALAEPHRAIRRVAMRALDAHAFALLERERLDWIVRLLVEIVGVVVEDDLAVGGALRHH